LNLNKLMMNTKLINFPTNLIDNWKRPSIGATAKIFLTSITFLVDI
jgi:hypothetical protein